MRKLIRVIVEIALGIFWTLYGPESHAEARYATSGSEA